MTDSEQGVTADFFVHPDFHRLKGRQTTDEVYQYEAALRHKIGASALPILIYDPNQNVTEGDFWHRFPDAQRFRSMPESGHLHRGDNTELHFNTLLEEKNILKGVVHGSYLGECVQAFKASLHARRGSGILYANSLSVSDIDNTAREVRYGIVLRDGAIPLRSAVEFRYIRTNPEMYRFQPEYYAEDAHIYVSG